MFEVTEAARAEIERAHTSSLPPGHVLRLARGAGGALRLAPDQAIDGDVVLLVYADETPALVTSAALDAELDGAIVHFRGTGDDRYGDAGLVVLYPRGSSARTEWRPPVAPRSQRSPLRLFSGLHLNLRRPQAPASTTQNAAP
jgi:hypothetical protein